MINYKDHFKEELLSILKVIISTQTQQRTKYMLDLTLANFKMGVLLKMD